MMHDIIDNRESYLADAVGPLLNESVRAYFAVGYFFLSEFEAITKEAQRKASRWSILTSTSQPHLYALPTP